MKKVFTILSVSFVLAIGACGASDTPTVSSRFSTISWQGEGPEPRIDPPDLPPPRKRSLVRDIRVGSGPVARKGDRVAVYYFGVSYETGEMVFSTWRPESPLTMPLSAGVAWEKGIVGMRVGGRREMIIPSHLAFGEGALIYIVDLAAVKPAPGAQLGG